MRRVEKEKKTRGRKPVSRTNWAAVFLRPKAILSGCALLALAFAGAGGAWMWRSGMITNMAQSARSEFFAATAETGLAVRAVYVEGRKETSRNDLIVALGTNVGAPILAFDPAAARERVEALGWVKRASVERRLPGVVHLRIEERTAVAIWQRDGRHVLIDADGVEIGEQDVNRHRHLKLVVGPDAPRHVMPLLKALEAEDELADRVVAAQRVGERRWNLRLDSGIDIRLPEGDMLNAWRRLAGLERDHGILRRAIETIDLRQPDRLIVRMTKDGTMEIEHRRKEAADAEET